MAKNNAGAKDKNKKPNRFVAWVKSIFIELKKVTWPSLPTVVKQTLVVLGVTLAFLVVFMGVDALLGVVYNWFIGNLI